MTETLNSSSSFVQYRTFTRGIFEQALGDIHDWRSTDHCPRKQKPGFIQIMSKSLDGGTDRPPRTDFIASPMRAIRIT